jgi:hypothetical protein
LWISNKDYKSFFEDGYKKQTLDSLKVEAVRLATFSTFPSSACAYATKLASAGFYYNGNGDEVVSFFGILVSGTLVEGCAYVSPFSKYLFRSCLVSGGNNSHVVPQAPVA